MKKDLLDELAKAIGCNYLSDLRQIDNFEQMVDHLDKMDENTYPSKQWRDAIDYILGKNAGELRDGESPKEFLCRKMKRIC